MKRLKLKKRFHSLLKGIPATNEVRPLERPETLAVLPSRIPHIKPKLLVRKNDIVSIGTPLFQDKRYPDLRYLSPAAGEVVEIRFGARRAIDEVVIQRQEKEMMDPGLSSVLSQVKTVVEENNGEETTQEKGGGRDAAEIQALLINAGMWQMIRQLPFMDHPTPQHSLTTSTPVSVSNSPSSPISDSSHPDTSRFSKYPILVISLQPGDMFSPSAATILDGREEDFLWGLAIAEKLASSVVVAAPKHQLPYLKSMEGLYAKITHITEDAYPAGDPGVILYQIKTNVSENGSVAIHPQDLLAIGALFGRGQYDLQRILTVAGSGVDAPSHVRVPIGSPVSLLTTSCRHPHPQAERNSRMPDYTNFAGQENRNESKDDDVDGDGGGKDTVVGGVFTGRHVLSSFPERHMAPDEYSAVVLESGNTELFFGFMLPGTDAVSESPTFTSTLSRVPRHADMNLHGEERACVNCGLCDKKCPVDLLPQFIMKAVRAGGMEEGIELGMLDCTLCGLCSYVCPSKIDLVPLFSMAKDIYYQNRVEITEHHESIETSV